MIIQYNQDFILTFKNIVIQKLDQNIIDQIEEKKFRKNNNYNDIIV